MKNFLLGLGAGVVASGVVFGAISYFGQNDPAAEETASSGQPLDMKLVKPIREMRPYMGQWSSDVGALPKMTGKWVVLWIAIDGSYQLEYRRPGSTTGVITDMWKGKLKELPSGQLQGEIFNLEPELEKLSTFRLSQPENGKMSITGDDVSLVLTFQGL